MTLASPSAIALTSQSPAPVLGAERPPFELQPGFARRPPSVRSPRKAYSDRLARATPAWADRGQIYRIYNEAADLRAEGIPATVDHFYPLAGELVSGLHVHQNLRIVSHLDNSRKNNGDLAIPVLAPQPTPQLSLF